MRKQGQHGFTMVEMLVVLSVTALVSVMILPGWRSGQQSLALEREAHKVAQEIRKTMELALRAEDSTACNYPMATGTFSGYGIYFNSTIKGSYSIFVECSGVDSGYKTSGNDRDAIIRTIVLDSAVEIASVIVASGNDWSIEFHPPDPLIGLCGNDPCTGVNDFSTAAVVLRLKNNPTKTKTITVNDRGLIDVD